MPRIRASRIGMLRIGADRDPRQTPSGKRILATVGGSSNSRFLTECYHVAAVLAPPHCRKLGLDPNLRPLRTYQTRQRGSLQLSRTPQIVNLPQLVRGQPAPFRGGCWRQFGNHSEPNREPSWGSGGLAAEEGRDVEMILLRGIVHRSLTPMGVESLMRGTSRIVRDRVWSPHFRGPRGRTLLLRPL
jgi:hypothetical protein